MTPEQRSAPRSQGLGRVPLREVVAEGRILARIRRDPTISEPVRQRALDLARQAVSPAVASP